MDEYQKNRAASGCRQDGADKWPAGFLEKNIASIMPMLERCGIGAAQLVNAVSVLHKMVRGHSCFQVLALSGAMVHAGMEEIVCQLIERKILHAIVSTGANITHSLLNVLGKSSDQIHYQATGSESDPDLWKHHVYRIYDTLVPGKSFVTTTMQAAMAYVLDAEIAQFIQERPVAYFTGPMTSGKHYHHVHHHIHHFGHYHHTG